MWKEEGFSSSVILLELSITQQKVGHSRQKETLSFPHYVQETVENRTIQSYLQHLSLPDVVNIYIFLVVSFIFVWFLYLFLIVILLYGYMGVCGIFKF